VAAQIWGVHWHDNHVSDAPADLLLTPRAEVRLAGLKRVYPPDLDRARQRGINAHSRTPAMTANAATTMM
jgi:hypothetical protein